MEQDKGFGERIGYSLEVSNNQFLNPIDKMRKAAWLQILTALGSVNERPLIQ
jgi:hypothetical protein